MDVLVRVDTVIAVPCNNGKEKGSNCRIPELFKLDNHLVNSGILEAKISEEDKFVVPDRDVMQAIIVNSGDLIEGKSQVPMDTFDHRIKVSKDPGNNGRMTKNGLRDDDDDEKLAEPLIIDEDETENSKTAVANESKSIGTTGHNFRASACNMEALNGNSEDSSMESCESGRSDENGQVDNKMIVSRIPNLESGESIAREDQQMPMGRSIAIQADEIDMGEMSRRRRILWPLKYRVYAIMGDDECSDDEEYSPNPKVTPSQKEKRKVGRPRKKSRPAQVDVAVSEVTGKCTQDDDQMPVVGAKKLELVEGDVQIYTCEHCPKVFKIKGNLKSHLRVHMTERPYSCGICGMGFKSKDATLRHQYTHSGQKPFPCETCSRGFSSALSLKEHRAKHDDCYLYSCGVCQRSFRHISGMKRHLLIHSKDMPYPCEICGRKFAQKVYLRSHMLTHTGEKAFPCSICKKAFAHLSDLNRHKIIHSGTKPFVCQQCGAAFNDPSSHRRHVREHSRAEFTHHRRRPKEQADALHEPKPVQENRDALPELPLPQESLSLSLDQNHMQECKYGCSECGAIFSCPDQLQTHNYKHHGGFREAVKQFCNLTANASQSLDIMAAKSTPAVVNRDPPLRRLTLEEIVREVSELQEVERGIKPSTRDNIVATSSHHDQLNGEGNADYPNDNGGEYALHIESAVMSENVEIGMSYQSFCVDGHAQESPESIMYKMPAEVRQSGNELQEGINPIYEEFNCIQSNGVSDELVKETDYKSYCNSELQLENHPEKCITADSLHHLQADVPPDDANSPAYLLESTLDKQLLLNLLSSATHVSNPNFSSQEYYNWLSTFTTLCKIVPMPINSELFMKISLVHKTLSDVLAAPVGILSNKDNFQILMNISRDLHKIISEHLSFVLKTLEEHNLV